jgi:hypothetical protein
MKTVKCALVLVAAASLLTVACSSSDPNGGTVSDDAGAGENKGDAGAGESKSDAAVSGEKGLVLNASLGIEIADRLIGSETSYASGLVLVKNNGKDVSDAQVTVNGTTLPLATMFNMPMDGEYDAATAAFSQPITAGGTLSFKAVQGGSTTTLDAPCPKEVTITSPVDGAEVTPGDKLTVTWSGSLDTGAWIPGAEAAGTLSNLFKSTLQFYAYDSVAKEIGSFEPNKKDEGVLAPSATSATITVPDAGKDGLVLKLVVTGKLVNQTSSAACHLSRRVVLKVKK